MADQPKLLHAIGSLKFAAAAPLHAAAGRLFSLPYDLDTQIRLDLLIGDQSSRVTIASGDRHTSFVWLANGRVSVWDHVSKSHFTTAKAVPPMKLVRPPKLSIELMEDGDTATAEVMIADHALGRIRQQMVFTKRSDLQPYAASLLHALHCGPACHAQSGLPLEQLAKAGCLVSESCFLGDSDAPAMHLALDFDLVSAEADVFAPPAEFVPVSDLFKQPAGKRHTVAARAQAAGQRAQAMMTQATLPSFKGDLTPACLGETRFGSMSATIHQDAVDHITNFINALAPLCGTASLSSIPGTDEPTGSLSIRWLASLAAINAGSGVAPGSGLFCLLRDPRIPSTGAGGPAGGTGLLDRIAAQLLTTPDSKSGKTRLQQEFSDHTMVETLVRWGVGQSIITALIATRGDMTTLTGDQQIAIVEGYETTDLGIITLTGLPDSFSNSFDDPWGNALLDYTATRFEGNFFMGAPAGTPAITSAVIGPDGDIEVDITLPDFILAATLSVAPTEWGVTVLSTVTLASCLIFPVACALLLPSAILLLFIVTNVTSVKVSGTGVSLSVKIQYKFNPDTSRIEPFVTTTKNGGTVDVHDDWTTPNLISNLFLSFLTSVGDLFNWWVDALVGLIGVALEGGLRSGGLAFPVGQAGLTVTGGGASSTAQSDLTLFCDVQPISGIAAQPFITQVAPSELIQRDVRNELLKMRQQLNPQPATAPPGPGPAITVGSYLGLGLSQNVLNYYLFSRWLKEDFNIDITGPATVAQLAALAPAGTFPIRIATIHVWPATAPRVEISMDGIRSHSRPLVVYFDDIRVCFEGSPHAIRGGQVTPAWELSFNAKTTATISLDWPLAFGLLADVGPNAVEPCDTRSWEFIDLNIPDVMAAHPGPQWAELASRLSQRLLRPLDAAAVVPPPQPRDWNRGFVAMQQELVPSATAPIIGTQQFYLEIEGHQRALYLLTAFDTTLIELFDGSGAPTLNGLFGNPTPRIALATMTCAQGAGTRSLLGPMGHQIPP